LHQIVDEKAAAPLPSAGSFHGGAAHVERHRILATMKKGASAACNSLPQPI
jgi:hypothetical protein